MAGLVYFFSTKAFLISAIIIVKIIYLGFLVSHINKVAPIIWIFRVSSSFRLSIVYYIISYLALSLVLDLGSGSLSILFIVEYKFF